MIGYRSIIFYTLSLIDGKTKIKKGNTVDLYFVATGVEIDKSKTHVYGLAKVVEKVK